MHGELPLITTAVLSVEGQMRNETLDRSDVLWSGVGSAAWVGNKVDVADFRYYSGIRLVRLMKT